MEEVWIIVSQELSYGHGDRWPETHLQWGQFFSSREEATTFIERMKPSYELSARAEVRKLTLFHPLESKVL